MLCTKRAFVRLSISIAATSAAVPALASASFFDAANAAANTSERNAWLTACGVTSGQYFEDFEAIAVGTNLHGQTGLLPGGLVIWDTSTAHAAFVQSSSSFFGGNLPLDTRGVAHNEQAYLELDFTAAPVDYVAGFDLDHTGTVLIVTFIDDTTEQTNLDSAQPAEFWGVWRNDKPRIKRIQLDSSGDHEWGIDNLEYGVVPEPATLCTLGIGAFAIARRRRV
ncbi:MAG: PEP-CTERM sorting domain-containing protein [Armatimonadetes bacterium]|nr:PEP-CTERM sorting domain-containing protein [Armatimonadota bacterium]